MLNRLFAATLAATLSVPALALDAEKLYEKVSPSVWVVNTFGKDGKRVGQGSGVVVAPQRLATNCHVLRSATKVVVQRRNTTHLAELELVDPDRDICQLKVEDMSAPPVARAPMSSLRVGQKVYALGSPSGQELTLSDGIVSSLRLDNADRIEMIQTSAPISPGSSGGGLFDVDGRLLGLTTLVLADSRHLNQNLNYALPASYLDELPARSRAAMAARDTATSRAAAEKRAAETREAAAGTVGARWEYTITDLFTGVKSRVALVVERIDGDKLYMNNGSRVELADGKLLEMSQPILGEMDNSMPANGWIRPDMKPGQTWELQYAPPGTPGRTLRLSARVAPEESLFTTAGKFEVQRIDFDGNLVETPTRNQGRSPQSTAYKATIWYAPQINRVVKMKAQSIGPFVQINEMIELSAQPGGQRAVAPRASATGGNADTVVTGPGALLR
ncbi:MULTISPECIES: S1C family serine protease [Pandoraea]|uniref:Serine protease n=1 Tax=Pandoraea norimbergensis TaxID=93219 RepID=A0ABN4JL93_9BURK|nr:MULTISPECIES: serine protease [Pandoraea]ALS61644.1 hypothetical protein AT302_19565 [Pandoraea norimbergensis]VVE10523.1 Periplasmic pH-dependent serine endoprotease DegQ [Pandoraea iniqua]